MKVVIVPIVVGTLSTITKGLVNGLEDLDIREKVETTETIELLRSARKVRRLRETWADLLSLKWKTIN